MRLIEKFSKSAHEIARELIDTEIQDFKYDPIEYVRSMGWDTRKLRIRNRWDVEGVIRFSEEEVRELAKIVEKYLNRGVTPNEIRYEDEVSDWLANFMVQKIIDAGLFGV